MSSLLPTANPERKTWFLVGWVFGGARTLTIYFALLSQVFPIPQCSPFTLLFYFDYINYTWTYNDRVFLKNQ